jgi:AraC-like DNA-binding protein
MRQSPVTSSSMPPTAGGGIARLAMARATAAGVDPEPLLHGAGLTLAQVEDRDARIGVRHQILLLNRVADAVGDDRLGFHLAERFDLREIGLLYYVLASSATLGEALARIERYSTVTNEGIEVQCRHDGELRVHVSYVGVPRHADCHQMEFWATAFVRVCRHLTGTHLKPVRVRLAHPRRGSSGEPDAFFGCKVAFGAEGDEIAFARGASQLPLTGADPYLNELLVGSCEEILARRCTPASPVRARVENAIAPLLPHGRAHVAEIARTLGMSRRTLARRLAAEGVTFTGILEEMRRDPARRYLGDTSLSVSQIAWLLGFQEVSAFTGAFKRWTGTTPTQVRMQSAPVAGGA